MSRATAITGPLAELVKALGGVEKAAAKFGVHRYTLYRWGTHKTEASQQDWQRVNQIARALGLTEPF
jgi:DNA invertase Pin-like site-specific DNA recombinase